MTELINFLPYDMNWYIASFIDDIDIRRKYNIYHKIDIDKYNFINKNMRNFSTNNGSYKRFYLQNLDDSINRSEYHINNDMLELYQEINEDKVYTEMHIFRLLPKPYPEFESYKDIYYKGNLSNTHYWKYIVICSNDF